MILLLVNERYKIYEMWENMSDEIIIGFCCVFDFIVEKVQ